MQWVLFIWIPFDSYQSSRGRRFHSITPESVLGPQVPDIWLLLGSQGFVLGDDYSGFLFLLLFLVCILPAIPFSSFPSTCFQSTLLSEEPFAAFFLVAFLIEGFCIRWAETKWISNHMCHRLDSLCQREMDVSHSPESHVSHTESGTSRFSRCFGSSLCGGKGTGTGSDSWGQFPGFFEVVLPLINGNHCTFPAYACKELCKRYFLNYPIYR